MRLTKLKALQLCEEMWRWLARHPKEEKDAWPGWGKYGEANNDCWACHYAVQEGVGCRGCILYGLWRNACSIDSSSPYALWSDNIHRTKNALIIADFCKAEIKKLKKREAK